MELNLSESVDNEFLFFFELPQLKVGVVEKEVELVHALSHVLPAILCEVVRAVIYCEGAILPLLCSRLRIPCLRFFDGQEVLLDADGTLGLSVPPVSQGEAVGVELVRAVVNEEVLAEPVRVDYRTLAHVADRVSH